MRQSTPSKQIWPIPAWVVALAALILILLFVACYILFWPRYPNASLSGPVQHQTKRLSAPSSLSPTAPAEKMTETAATPSQPILPPPPIEITVPAATAIAVRTSTLIDSDANPVGSRFAGTIVAPIVINGQVAVPQGSAVMLRLADKKKTGFFHRSLQIKLALSGVSVNGRIYPAQGGTVDMKAGDSNGSDGNPTPKGKKALVVLPNTEMTFTLTAPFTIETPSSNAGK